MSGDRPGDSEKSESPIDYAAFALVGFSELVATAFLLIAVVGSGIAADRLCAGNVGLALFVNAVVTGAALFAIIVAFAPLSGAHLNPVVTLAAVLCPDGLAWRIVPIYLVAQVTGAVLGVWIAHVMFGLPILEIGTHVRTGTGPWVAEIVATFGLLAVIWGSLDQPRHITAAVVGAYIAGAYWFTSSTSFANPAVTAARALTDTFAGIRPTDVSGFIVAQMIGLALALPLIRTRARLAVGR
ncbi:MAG: aquaporin family protein [Rhodospirillaceae bacterium]|nr:MAG: aquaporin family protein [Rhodospirillaceae bacterium]